MQKKGLLIVLFMAVLLMASSADASLFGGLFGGGGGGGRHSKPVVTQPQETQHFDVKPFLNLPDKEKQEIIEEKIHDFIVDVREKIGNGYNGGCCEDPPKTQPVPEPATMVLLGIGLLGIAGYGRKKFKN